VAPDHKEAEAEEEEDESLPNQRRYTCKGVKRNSKDE
jgi:hypothetical protein